MKILLLLFTISSSALAHSPPAHRFNVETLFTDIPQPMHLEYGPDGMIYFIEIAGKIQRIDPTTSELATLGELTVTNDQENGLLGMALDPDFLTNQHLPDSKKIKLLL